MTQRVNEFRGYSPPQSGEEQRISNSMDRGLFWVMPMLSLPVWVTLMNFIGFFTWGHGPSTFLALCGLVLLLFILSIQYRSRSDRRPAHRRWSTIRLFVAALIVVGGSAWTLRGIAEGMMEEEGGLIDISLNTFAAAKEFIQWRNPYTTRTQLWHTPEAEGHITVTDEGMEMFGLDYYSGYPYFPAMFLTYAPFVATFGGINSMRICNVLLLAMNLIGVVWLTLRHTDGSQRVIACMTSVAAHLCIFSYPHEIFSFGIVDILICTHALYAFVALTYHQDWIGGVLLGLAQACKLLPGPLLLLAALLVLRERRRIVYVFSAYAITSMAVILPFVISNPEGFLSATALYYLTYHAGGDNTSLWFFLPAMLKTPFLIAGFLATGATLLIFAFGRKRTIVDAAAGSFCSYALFSAFAKMSHLNYLWGVYGLGCLALAVYASKVATPCALDRKRESVKAKRLLRAGASLFRRS
jgi:hypothetical protein